jgi:hypothetical protein
LIICCYKEAASKVKLLQILELSNHNQLDQVGYHFKNSLTLKLVEAVNLEASEKSRLYCKAKLTNQRKPFYKSSNNQRPVYLGSEILHRRKIKIKRVYKILKNHRSSEANPKLSLQKISLEI